MPLPKPKSMTKDDARKLFQSLLCHCWKALRDACKTFYPYFDLSPMIRNWRSARPPGWTNNRRKTIPRKIANFGQKSDKMGAAGLQQNPFYWLFSLMSLKFTCLWKWRWRSTWTTGRYFPPTPKNGCGFFENRRPDRVIAEVDKSAVKELQKSRSKGSEIWTLQRKVFPLSLMMPLPGLHSRCRKMPIFMIKICAVKREIARNTRTQDTQMPRIQQAFQRGAEQGQLQKVPPRWMLFQKIMPRLQQKFVSVSETC